MFKQYLNIFIVLFLAASILGAVCTASAVPICGDPLNLNVKINETFRICLKNGDEIHYDKNYVEVKYPWCGTYPVSVVIKPLKTGHTTINVTNSKTKNINKYNVTINPI